MPTGGTITFNVVARGSAPSNTSGARTVRPIPGATGTSYTITNAGPGDAAFYDVLAIGGCNSVASSGANLTVRCAADFNLDGLVNSLDFFEFLNCFLRPGLRGRRRQQ